ncbi:MAG: hypothetical protein LUG54_07365 [Clostridiales bacterium]|nr:hypothetical protein [Clostridiales bacterium]
MLKIAPLKRQAFAGSQYRHGTRAGLHRIYQGQEQSDGVRRFSWLHRCSACGITCPSGEVSYPQGMLCKWTFREERTSLTAGKDTTAHRVGGE